MQIVKDISDYSLKQNLKEKCFHQLYNLVVCGEDRIKEHASSILKLVYRHIRDEEKEIAQRVRPPT